MMVRSTMSPSSSISVITLFLMWSHLWGYAFGQSSVTPASSTTISPNASPTPNTTISFQSIPTLTTCQTYRIQWTYAGDVEDYNITLHALGSEGNVTTTPSASDSTVAATASRPLVSTGTVSTRKRAPGDRLDQTIARVAADDSSYDFFVNLPFGRYYLHGRMDNSEGTGANSPLFWVMEGSDTSCVGVQGAIASPSSSVKSSASVSSTFRSAVSSAAAVSAENESGNGGGIGGGAIAGIVIGVVGGLAAIAALWFFCFRRKRKNDVEISGPSMVTRGPGFGSGATLTAMAAGATHRSSRHSGQGGGHIPLTSMGGSAEGHEKGEPLVGSYGSDSNALTPSSLSGGNPFATAPNTPMGVETTTFAFNDIPMSDDDTPVTAIAGGAGSSRRQSQPIPSSPKAGDRNRSNSQPSHGPSGKVDVKRNVSARRKPVPSLGAELKKQMQKERAGENQEGAGAQTQTLRQSYHIMPDPPRANQ